MLNEEEIDDVIDCWHDGQFGNKELWDVLGWTVLQYAEWVQFGTIPKEE